MVNEMGDLESQETPGRKKNRHAAIRALTDGLIFAAFIWIISLARYDFSLAEPNYPGIAICSAIAFLTVVIAGSWQTYRGRYPKASADELVAIGGMVAVACGIMYLLNAFQLNRPLVPMSTPVSAAAMTVVTIGVINWARATARYRQRSKAGTAKSALIIGAGAHGMLALRIIRDDPREEYVAVGLLDDDPAKRHLRADGVRVLGTLDNVSRAIERSSALTLILAIPALDPSKLDELMSAAAQFNIDVKVLPEFDATDIRHREVSSTSAIALRPGSFRSVELDDLIGRQPIHTDVESISSYLEGRTVLVTGAGGSIGSFLCSQIARFTPGRLVMTDRDESGLHATQLVLEGSASLTSENLVLGDLRDRNFIRSLFDEVRPDIVFHAAALKHLTFLERFPDEAIKTNIGASLELLEAARDFDVQRFVHISTDKAADPTSVLGATKFATERVVAAMAAESGQNFISVRFGNVLGSRGSVLGTFVTQVSAGGPVTVTAPGAKRFFMTAAEACELVLQAGAIGKPGESLVLDMGDLVSIEDLAKRVIALSGRTGVEIVYTGLRPGEKMLETRLGSAEVDERPSHPLITQVPIEPVDLQSIRTLLRSVEGRVSAEDRKLLRNELSKQVALRTEDQSVPGDNT